MTIATDGTAALIELRERLREAEETLDAIRSGDVDAVVVASEVGTKVYSLETADQTYRALVEEMQEGALTLARDGTVLYCNRTFANLVGEELSVIMGAPLARYVALAEAERLAGVTESYGKGEFDIMSQVESSSVPAHLSFAPLLASHGQPDAICCIVTDLSEQKKISDALQQVHERLVAEVKERERTEALLRQSQKMEAVGQMTGGVAHDFNNLLMAVTAGLKLLDSQTDPVKLRRIKDSMRQALDRGAKLTQQLLTFSRNKALVAVAVDVAGQIGAMGELIDRSLGGHITVALEFPSDLWPIQVDVGEFELVVLNLCINARDAMPHGGMITLRAHNHPQRHGDTLVGDFVCLVIGDTGNGMSAETIAHAFEPFFTTKDIGKGSGLGLAQAYGFAQAAGGRIKIDSELGRGTEIALLLPRSLQVPEQRVATTTVGVQSAASAEKPAVQLNGHVLLVEDDDDVAVFTLEILLELGCRVSRAETANAALSMLTEGEPVDLVFSDVMMPGGMNGIELTRLIRSRIPTLPIVLTSGYASAFAHEAQALEVDLLSKPYDFQDLESLLRQRL